VNTTAGYNCFIAMGSAMKCYTSKGVAPLSETGETLDGSGS